MHNCALWKGEKKKEPKTGDLIIPFIFDECPTLPGSKAQILYHWIPQDDQVFCGEVKLIVSQVIKFWLSFPICSPNHAIEAWQRKWKSCSIFVIELI